jgi:hypothetical protein
VVFVQAQYDVEAREALAEHHAELGRVRTATEAQALIDGSPVPYVGVVW